MTYKGVILDLDQTLVDSAVLDALRKQRAWSDVYKRIGDITAYPGILDLLADLKGRDIRLAVVTSSPKPYCSRVLEHFKFPIDYMVCYHDTTNRKPHPEPMHKALELLGLHSSKVKALGDDIKDIESARGAKIFNVACTWGAADKDALAAAGADFICHTVAELRAHLLE